jgi:hypothetical protein
VDEQRRALRAQNCPDITEAELKAETGVDLSFVGVSTRLYNMRYGR